MEFINSKHSKIIVGLEIGDKVMSNINGKRTDYVINGIELKKNTQTGIVVRLDKYPYWIDSDWIEK